MLKAITIVLSSIFLNVCTVFQADMTNMEMQLIAEKKYRENSLNFKKKQIDKIRVKDATAERHRRAVSPWEWWAPKVQFNQ